MHSLILQFSVVFLLCSSCNFTSGQAEQNQSLETASVAQGEPKEALQLKMQIEGKIFTIELEGNATTKALMETLPFSTPASVYHGNHYYAPVPKALPANGLKPTFDAVKGGIYYSVEYKGLGVFFEGGHFDGNELYYIGKVKEDISGIDGSNKMVEIKFEK